jgi:hypothetical protein
MNFQAHRPPGYLGLGDPSLPRLIDELEQVLVEAQAELVEAISPAFVRRLVRDYGPESIAAAFLIRDTQNYPYLDYLLRRHKGHFYRNRYPSVSVI